MKNTLTLDTSGLDAIANVLKDFPYSAEEAMQRTLYKTKGKVRTETILRVPKVYGISPDMMRDALVGKKGKPQDEKGVQTPKKVKRFARITSGEHCVYIEVVGARLGAVRFEHTPDVPSRLSVPHIRVLRSGPMKELSAYKTRDGKKHSIFLASTGTYATDKIPYALFYRTGVKKPDKDNSEKMHEEIRSVRSLSVAQMIMHPKVSQPLLEEVSKAMSKTFEQEVNYEFLKMETSLAQMKEKLK